MRTRQKRYPSEVSDAEVSDGDSAYEEEEPQRKRTKPSDKDREHKDKFKTVNDPRNDSATIRLIAQDPKEGLLWLDESARDDRGQKVGKWIRAVYHNDIRSQLIAKASRNGILKYEVPRSRGPNEDDVTSFHPEQDTWRSERQYWGRIRDDILHRLARIDKNGNDYVGPYYLHPLQRWFEGERLVIDEGARPVIKFPDLPDTISSQIEGWLMAAWLRLDDRISRRDIWARIPRQYTASNGRKMGGIQLSALGNRYNRFMQDQGLPAWDRKKDSCPLILDRLPQLCKDNNSTRPEYGGRSLDEAERYIVDNYGKGHHLAKAGDRRISDEERSKRAARTRKPVKARRIKNVDTAATSHLDSLSHPPAPSSTRSTALTGGSTVGSSFPYSFAPATTGGNASDQSLYFSQPAASQPSSSHGRSDIDAYPDAWFSNPATAVLQGRATQNEPSDLDFGFNFQPDPTVQLLGQQQNGDTHGLGFGGNVYFTHGTGINDFDYDSFFDRVNNGYGPNRPLYEYTDREQLIQTFSTEAFGSETSSVGHNAHFQCSNMWQPMQMLNNQWPQADGFSQIHAAAAQQSAEMPDMHMSVDEAWTANEEVVWNVQSSTNGTNTSTTQSSAIAQGNQDANEQNLDPVFTTEFMAEMDEMINAPLTREDFIQQNPIHHPNQASSTKPPDEGEKKRKRALSNNATEGDHERPAKRQATVDPEEPSEPHEHPTWRATGRKTVPGYTHSQLATSNDVLDDDPSRIDVMPAVEGTSSDDAEGETDDEAFTGDGNVPTADGNSSDDAEGVIDDELPQADIDVSRANSTPSKDAKGETDEEQNDDMASLFEEEHNDTNNDTASNANDSTTKGNNDLNDAQDINRDPDQSNAQATQAPRRRKFSLSMTCVVS